MTNLRGKAGSLDVDRSSRAIPRSLRGQRTREAVLRAAVVVFGREGVRQTSMLAVAQEAGVASGTVYQYFIDKEDIFRCLLADLDERLVGVLESNELGGLDAGEAIGRYLATVRENVPAFRAWWDLLQPPSEFTNSWLALHKRLADAVRATADVGHSRGGTLDPEIVGDIFAAFLERSGYTRSVMGWDEELTEDDVVELGSRLFAGI